MKVEALKQWRKLERRRLFIVSGIGAAVLLLVIGAVILFSGSGAEPFAYVRSDKPSRTALSSTVRINLPPPDLYRPITPEEALRENAKREFSQRPDSPAAAFILKASASNRERAIECLTQAIYYEAATEDVDGQKAVAQIVLNRMRHPGYPSSVCGVVYEGSERSTGCQFTFTCDGSLARIPVQSLWKLARRIATEALSGKVFGSVGHSTHYHADYVLPYWADSLDKSVQIGRHIFYRLKSGLGSASAFRQRYSGVEPTPPAPSTIGVSIETIEKASPELSTTIPVSPLQVEAGELISGSERKPELAADIAAGTLIIDRGDPVRRTSRAADEVDCPKTSTDEPLRPLSANDNRINKQATDCP